MTRFAGNIALLTASILAALGICEIVLRVHDPFRERLVADTSEVNEIAETSLDGALFEGEGNSLGLRDEEYPLEHRRTRILAIGDSFTYGHRLRREHSWPKLTEALLQGEGYDVEVLNGGRSGTDTAMQLRLFSRYTWRYRPDIVIVAFLVNDCTEECSNCGAVEFKEAFDREVRREPGPSRLWRFLRLSLLKRRLTEETVREYRTYYDRDLPAYRQCRQAFLEFKEASEAMGFKLIVVIYPMLFGVDSRSPFEDIHQRMLDFFRRSGIEAHDLTPVFKGWNDTDLWIDGLDSHPNAVANRLVSRRIAEIVRDHLGAPTVR